MKYLRKFNESIDMLCKKYGISNYEIVDGLVNVDGDVNLSSLELTEIPIKFGTVTGYFNCYNNQLVSLEGCPSHIGGSFYCYNNQLVSLEGCPSHIGGSFYCSDNQLISLEYCPSSIGGSFYCSDNKLVSLEGCPSNIGGNFSCSNNPIYDLYNKFGRNNLELFLYMDINMDMDNEEVIDQKVDYLKSNIERL